MDSLQTQLYPSLLAVAIEPEPGCGQRYSDGECTLDQNRVVGQPQGRKWPLDGPLTPIQVSAGAFHHYNYTARK